MEAQHEAAARASKSVCQVLAQGCLGLLVCAEAGAGLGASGRLGCAPWLDVVVLQSAALTCIGPALTHLVYASRWCEARARSDGTAGRGLAKVQPGTYEWRVFQPFVGGPMFVMMQALGWSMLGASLQGMLWCAWHGVCRLRLHGLLLSCGLLSMSGQLLLLHSIQFFDGSYHRRTHHDGRGSIVNKSRGACLGRWLVSNRLVCISVLLTCAAHVLFSAADWIVQRGAQPALAAPWAHNNKHGGVVVGALRTYFLVYCASDDSDLWLLNIHLASITAYGCT